MPAVCTLGGALVGLLAANLRSTTMPDFIGTQNGQLSLPGIGTLGPLLLLSLLTSTFFNDPTHVESDVLAFFQ